MNRRDRMIREHGSIRLAMCWYFLVVAVTAVVVSGLFFLGMKAGCAWGCSW